MSKDLLMKKCRAAFFQEHEASDIFRQREGASAEMVYFVSIMLK